MKRIRPIILTLKPRYADLVFMKRKTAELRRRITFHIQNREAFVYVSSPTMSLRGGFRVGEFWTGPPDEIWKTVEDLAQVNKHEYDTYFEGRNVANAFEILDIWETRHLTPLSELRRHIPNFVVPQSWRYVRDAELGYFNQLKD